MGINTDRLRIYIAGPISGGNLCDNINNATNAFHRLRKAGLAPFCPHWSAFADGCEVRHHNGYIPDDVIAIAAKCPRDSTWSEWLEIDLPWVGVADAVLRLPGDSKGADAEVAFANEAYVPVFTDEAELLLWAAEEVAARKDWETALLKESIAGELD